MSEIRSKRYFILLMAELLCLLLLLPGCFRKEELIQSIYGEDIGEITTQTDDHLEFCSDRMELAPGVYEIRIQSRLADGQRMVVEMKYDNAYFNSLRGNVVTVFSGNDDMDFLVYALDKVPSAYVKCDFHGVGTEGLVQLDICRTNKGNRVVLFLTIVVFAVLDFLLEFRRRILDGRVTKRQQVVFWSLTVGVLIAYFPYLTDYFVVGADTLFHVSRIAWLKETLEQGVSLPVRVQSYWNYDHGYAVSMFYGDLFILIPTLLYGIGFPLMTSYKAFVLILLAATAFIAYHSFFRCMKEEYAALFGSVIYLLMPYHLFSIYNKSAVGEMLAITFFPLLFCGMYLLFTEKISEDSYKKHKWYIVWGISGVLQSHMLSTEMTVVFIVLFCIAFCKKTFRKETFLQLLEAAGIALFINIWFWLPFLYMLNADRYYLQNIVNETIQDRGIFMAEILQLLPQKGGASDGLVNCEPDQVGAAALMLLIIYVLWIVNRRERNKLCSILACFSLLTIVMSTKYFPWDAVSAIPGVGQFVSVLQFPGRFMVLAGVFVSMFVGFFILYIKESGGVLVKSAVGVAAVIAVGSAVYHVNSIAYETGAVYLYEAKNMGTKNVGGGEYLLEEVGRLASDVYYHAPVTEDGLDWSDYQQKGTNAELYLDNQTERTLHVEIPLMGYKGYKLKVSEQAEEIPYITEEVGNHGDLRIAVPAGYQGRISISYAGFPIFHAAEVISLVSLAAMICVYFYHKRKKIQNGNEIKTE